MPVSIKFAIPVLLILLASCGDNGWSIETAEVVGTGRGPMVEVRLPKELHDSIRRTGDVLYLEFLKCGETSTLASAAPLAFGANDRGSPREVQLYLVPKEALDTRSQPLCARLKRTGFGFNGSRSENFPLSLQGLR